MAKLKSFSIIVETENLGMAGVADLVACLDSLKQQKFPIKKAKEVLVIIGSYVSKKLQNELLKKYPWLIIREEKGKLDYVEAKAKGAKIATGDILVFVDTDVRYERSWLSNLLSVFSSHPEAGLVSGDTRPKINSSYAMAMAMSWMFVIENPINKPAKARSFQLNNFAIKRALVQKIPFPKNLPFYRGKGSIWRSRLLKNGAKIYRAPGTRGHHALPNELTDLLYRLLINGRDFIALADFTFKDNAAIEKRAMLRRFRNLLILIGWKILQIFANGYKIIKDDRKNIQYLPLGLCLALINVLPIAVGGLITCLNRDYLLKKINTYEAPS